MAWHHLDIDKPHLAYIILGGFTSLFMLCSLFVKEKLYIGEATVASLCGVIFGPHAADLFDPISWGNVDKITLECSRIVLVVQCFAVGVELPKHYMERHWKSVALLLLPVMTYGWLATSLFIWWMIPTLSWLEGLAIAACVTATDPVLASSVVGKGKFASRVPKHLRDLLSAESGCNDGMAFPFIYISVYILRYKAPGDVALHFICVTVLYECILGAIFGFTLGYVGRHAIRYAERNGLIDRESFLVFYFVLALFCAGSGSLLGLDDLLVGFSAGVGFSNDGWFSEKTEESHVSNVIDLLLNLAYFVYLGAVIPWQEFNAPELGIVPWRLVVIAILVIFFRRIPIMLALKPVIPDVKSWREAMFAGHFGPIGVGAIFACILTRAELETGSTQPLDSSERPGPGEHNYVVVAVIWPVTAFLVISSILVHGSSIAVFTLGKHINTLSITMSYTKRLDEEPSWMSRLPRIQSTASKSSISFQKTSFDGSPDEGSPETPGPINIPKNFLRRQRNEEDKDEEQESKPNSRASSRQRARRRESGPGGPISRSAIAPRRRHEAVLSPEEGISLDGAGERSPRVSPPEEPSREQREEVREVTEPELEVYQEGPRMVIEDEEGNVLNTADTSALSPEEQTDEVMRQHRRLEENTAAHLPQSQSQERKQTQGTGPKSGITKRMGRPYRHIKKYFSPLSKKGHSKDGHPAAPEKPKKEHTRRSARAYQFGNTVIVEDEDGEVVKQYTIPHPQNEGDKDLEAQDPGPAERPRPKQLLSRMVTWTGGGGEGESSQAATRKTKGEGEGASDDEDLRFTIPVPEEQGGGVGKLRMNKEDFIREIQQLDPKSRRELLEGGGVSSHTKSASRKDGQSKAHHRKSQQQRPHEMHVEPVAVHEPPFPLGEGEDDSTTEREENVNVPTHDVAASLAQYPRHETSGAEGRRRRLSSGGDNLHVPTTTRRRRDSEDDGTERIPPALLRQQSDRSLLEPKGKGTELEGGETLAERNRRLAALGVLDPDSGESRPVTQDRERDGDDNGNGNGNEHNGRGRTTHISWGGERGRNP